MDRERFVRRCRGRYSQTREHDAKGVIDVVEILPLVVQVPMVDVVEQEWEELTGRIDRVIGAAAEAAGTAMILEGEREEREGRERSGLLERVVDGGDGGVSGGGEVGVGGVVCGEGGAGVEDAGRREVLPPLPAEGEPPGVQPEGVESVGAEAEDRAGDGGGGVLPEVSESGGRDVVVEGGSS